jgi:hypothetical protein
MKLMSPREHMFIGKLKRLGEEKVRDDLAHNRYGPKYKDLAEKWLETRNKTSEGGISSKTLLVNVLKLIIAILAFAASIFFYFYPKQ